MAPPENCVEFMPPHWGGTGWGHHHSHQLRRTLHVMCRQEFVGFCNSSAWLPLSALLVKRFWLSWPTNMSSTVVLETKRHLRPPNVMGRGSTVWSDFRETSDTHSLCLSCARNKTATLNISFSPLVFCTSVLFSLVSLRMFSCLLSSRNWS